MNESQSTGSVCCESKTRGDPPNSQRNRTEKEVEYEQLREELKISDNHLAELRLEHVDVCNAYKAMLDQSTPNLFILLRKKLSRIERELKYETNVNQRIKTLLDKASEEITLERLHVPKLRSQHASVSCSLDSVIRFKERIAREARLVAHNEAILQDRRRHHESKLVATEFRMKKMEADSMDCLIKHKPFLARTLQDMRLRKLLDEKSSTRERLLQSAASLKCAIDKSKELMIAKKAREKAVADAEKQEEYGLALMEDEFSEDLDTELLLRRRVAQINARHKAFHDAQSRKRLEIVARILDEEQNWQQNLCNHVPLHNKMCTGKKQKRVQSKGRYNGRKPSTSALVGEQSAKPSVTKHLSPECKVRAHSRRQSDDGNSVEENIIRENEEDRCSHHLTKPSPINSTVLQEDVNTIVRSFVSRSSLRNYDQYQDRKSRNTLSGTEVLGVGKRAEEDRTSEREQLTETAVLRTRENITQPQQSGVRELRGPAFDCQPPEIWFKDFEPNTTIKTKLKLTNISLKICTCRFVGLSQQLMDFVTVQFPPSGALSPGMSCIAVVTFVPKIHQDLKGQMNFLCPTGAFSVPFKATTKKCELSIDTTTVEFGHVVIGETARRSVTLHNIGARGVNFRFQKMIRSEQRSEESGSKIYFCPQPVENDLNKENGAMQATVLDETVVEETEQPTAEVGTIQESDFYCGSLTSGFLDAFSSVTLEIVWCPKTTCFFEQDILNVQAEIERFLITFDDEACQPYEIFARGFPKELPTTLSNETMNLGICYLDRLYEDCFSVYNKTNSALRVTFKWDSSVANHLTICPKTGFAQAHGRLLAQVKFCPKSTIHSDLCSIHKNYQSKDSGERTQSDLLPSFEPASGVLEVPIAVYLSGQTNILKLVVAAVVTKTDLIFIPESLDFGAAEVNETVSKELRIVNNCMLPQKFGIVDLPQCIEVQPNNGFGILPPNGAVRLEFLFSPTEPKDYCFQVACKTEIGRKFYLTCSGIGVLTPIKLSANDLQFPPTPLWETSTVQFTIRNIHTSADPYTHKQPRIGSTGPVFPVGPIAFELRPIMSYFSDPESFWFFSLCNDATKCIEEDFLTIHPQTGTLLPGQSQLIQIAFNPCISTATIKELASRMLNEERKISREAASFTLDQNPSRVAKLKHRKISKTKEVSPSKNASKNYDKHIVTAECKSIDSASSPTYPDDVSEDSFIFRRTLSMLNQLYPCSITNILPNGTERTCANLAFDSDVWKCQWPGNMLIYQLACFVADGPGPDNSSDPTPKYRTENTLFLQLACPIVRPPLLVASNDGSSCIDFGPLCAGQNRICGVSVQNISPYLLQLTPRPLLASGPFELVGGICPLKVGETQKIRVKFSPKFIHSWCNESLQLLAEPVLNDGLERRAKRNLWSYPFSLKLKGVCVIPRVELSGPPDLSSSTTLQHMLGFGSILLGDWAERQLILKNPTEAPMNFSLHPTCTLSSGTTNASGAPVFQMLPNAGVIAPGHAQAINIIFTPESPGGYFTEELSLKLYDQHQNAQSIRLWGYGMSHYMYVRVDECAQQIEVAVSDLMGSNAYLGISLQPTGDDQSPSISYLTVRAPRQLEAANEFSAERPNHPDGYKIERSLIVGCVRSSGRLSRKMGEFVVEDVAELSARGFTINPTKGTVEAGTERTVQIKWVPNPSIQVGTVIRVVVKFILKADVTRTHLVYLNGLM